MIPVLLEISNFLSYRETAVLDFAGIHVAGISGANGAGKSSIMDAMTWALFGRSRTRFDDDLINRQAAGDEAAEVRFTFLLEEVLYRVIRRKQREKTMILELQMDAGDGEWRPLSEGKMRETQAEIEALLRMDYDNFINASFFLQGKADEFTTRTAGKRKEILADLLGVTQWDQYRERAAAARKAAEGSVDIIDARLAEIEQELREETHRRQLLAEAEALLATAVERRDLKELLYQEARQKDEARKAQQKAIAAIEGQLQRMKSNLQKSQETLRKRSEEREALGATLENAEPIEQAFAEWQVVDRELQELQGLASKHAELGAAMQPFAIQIAEARAALEQRQMAFAEQEGRADRAMEERVSLADRIVALEAEADALRRQLHDLEGVNQRFQEAGNLLRLQEGERHLWKQELETLTAQAARIAAAGDELAAARRTIEEAALSIEGLDEQIEVIEGQRRHLAALEGEVQALSGQQPALREQMKNLKDRIDLLETAGDGGTCPLCGQALSEEHRQTVIDRVEIDGRRYGDEFRANDKRLKALAVEIPQVTKTVQNGQILRHQRETQQNRLAQAQARLTEIVRAQTEWEEGGEKRQLDLAGCLADDTEIRKQRQLVADLESELQERGSVRQQSETNHSRLANDRARLQETERIVIEWQKDGKAALQEVSRQLEAEDFALEARQQLEEAAARQADLAYDRAAHQAAADSRERLAGAPAQYQLLMEARAALQPLTGIIEDLTQQVERQETEAIEQAKQLADAQQQLNMLEAGTIDLRQLEEELFRLRDEANRSTLTVDRAQQNLAVLDAQRERQKLLLDEKEKISLQIQRLTLLEKSCGQKGVQALLIEHALPEIEEEANVLLDRLTGGDMRVIFDTQRQLKSRDAVAETLDIVISDRAGERPYDNYSGGEQFRINFAIRLSLSKLLAKRASARLQTLVIDEGFGSQDPEGRQRLIEAINAVQDDFACILVITHIDELREAFPTRIEVTKERSGSQIAVA